MLNRNIFRTKEAKIGLIILLSVALLFFVIWFIKYNINDRSAKSIQGLSNQNKLGTVESISFDPKMQKYTLTIVFDNAVKGGLQTNMTDTVTITVEEQLLDSILKNYELKDHVNKSIIHKSETVNKDLPTMTKAQNNKIDEQEKIVFKVQFLMTKKYFDTRSDTFRNIENITYTKDGVFYKYYSGNESSFIDAKDLYNNITPYFPEAFIVAYKNGERIPVLDAKKILRNSAK